MTFAGHFWVMNIWVACEAPSAFPAPTCAKSAQSKCFVSAVNPWNVWNWSPPKAWYVRGLNPAGDGRRPPDDKDS